MRPACADRGCQPEEKWYALTGRVVDAKVEADGDIHLALQDADSKNAGTVSAQTLHKRSQAVAVHAIEMLVGASDWLVSLSANL